MTSKLIWWLKNHMQELDRGLATMRGELEPGSSSQRQDSPSGTEHGLGSLLKRAADLSLHDVTRPLKRLGGYLHPGGGPRLAVFALLLAMTLWGSVFVATKEVMGEAGPFTVAAVRVGIGLAVLLPLARRVGLVAQLVFSRSYLLFGFTGIFLAYGLQNLALVYTSASNASLVFALQPAAVMIMGMLFLREQLPVARLMGIGLAIAGLVMVSGAAFAGGGVGTLLGTVLMAGSVLAYGAYAAQGRVLGAYRSPSLITAASFATGLLFLLPFAAGEIYLYGAPEFGVGGWMLLLYLGVSTTAATFLLWNYALRHLEAGAAGLYFNLIPVTGLGFAVIFGANVGIMEMAGGALAISGVLVGDYLVRRKAPAYPQPEG
ncbi:hypothetical protein BH23ACT11_BH23ACT11_23600 [soil metagenome]